MRRVKFRKSLAMNIIAVFLVFNILSIVVFTYYVTVKEENKSAEYAKNSLREIAAEKSELISSRFAQTENQTRMLGTWTEKLLRKGGYSRALPQEYVLEEDGTISRRKDENKRAEEQSNVIVASTTEKTPELMEEINLTEELDEPFAQILENEDVTWAYIVTRDNLLRCSPYRSLRNAFTSDHSQIKDIFYTTADEENNPERKPVWTRPYTDYLGKGWTMTCSQPVYDEEDRLYGVICLDLAIRNIEEEYFGDFSLGESGKVYWLDKSGNILYHTDYNDTAENQGQVYEKNIFEEKPLTEEKEAALRRALRGEKGVETVSGSMMVYEEVEAVDSVLIIEIDMEEFRSETTLDLRKIGLLIVIDAFLAAVFAVILYCKFSLPMKQLVRGADRISKGDYSYIKKESEDRGEDYYEIAQLKQAFKSMNDSIEGYTETLLDRSREISTVLETIEETLMIVGTDGRIRIRSKDFSGVSQEDICRAVKRIEEERLPFSEQTVVNGEVYKNIYYPIMKADDVIDKIVISSECITKNILMEKELQQLEKMAGVGQLSAAIVHELKNTLALIKGAAYILNLLARDGEGREEVRIIMKAVEEAENLMTTLLDFSRKDSGGSEMIHIGTLINQILLLSKKEIIGRGIRVEAELDDGCYICSSGREALKVILQNIIINAVQAVDSDGRIEISCGREKGRVWIKVRDDGGGIAVEPKERIFEPFLTTKEEGIGIGLWITKRLSDSLGGRIEVTEPAQGETEFTLYLPEGGTEEERDNDENTDTIS